MYRATVAASVLALTIAWSAGAATHAVAQTGDDRTGDGSADRPWATLSHAATKAVSGDTIRLATGEFQDKTMALLAPGVSVEGAGIDKTVIRARVNDTPYLKLNSDVGRDGSLVDGRQSIHDLTIDGCRTVRHAVAVHKRHHVEIFNLKVVNCTWQTILAHGVLNGADTSQWMRGFKVHDCIIDGEMPETWKYLNGIIAYRQIDPEFYRNKVSLRYGQGVGVMDVKGSKIHHNTIETSGIQPGYQNEFFAIWMRHFSDGCEIYENTCNNGISCENGQGKGNGTWSLIVHHNTVKMRDGGNFKGAVLGMELGGHDIWVHHNYVQDGDTGIMQGYHTVQNSLINHNVVVGRRNSAFCIGINPFKKGLSAATYTPGVSGNIRIYNNTLSMGTEGASRGCIHLLGGEGWENLQVKNNIFLKGKYGIDASRATGAFTNIEITNNFYTDISSSFIYDPNKSFAEAAIRENQDRAPGLMLSGELPLPYLRPTGPESPVVGAGVDVGLPYQGKAPDIGAYESEPSPATRP